MECPYWNMDWRDIDNGGRHSACHNPIKNGRIGKVLRTDYSIQDGHRFEIVYVYNGKFGHYAAIELVPVDYSENKF